ncbi:MAG: cyclase family protein [Armatimonadota bacterium]|nr:cyclase family protein [Armatimonadota bacterium]
MESYIVGRTRVTLIDLSDTLENETSAFEPNRHQIQYVDHVQGMHMTVDVFKVDQSLLPALFPDGHAWAVEVATLSSHSGTHIDAPYHYGPTSGGEPAKTIEQLPLRWFFSDAFVLDMTHKQRGEGITAADVEASLAAMGYAIKPYDIALVRTDTWKAFKQPGYDMLHPGLERSATQYLVERGVKVIGIDAWGLDRPFDVMFREAASGVRGRFWESHFYGKEREYCQIEKLTNLDKIPRPFGFKVACFPYKLKAASAAWTRAVAIIEEPIDV